MMALSAMHALWNRFTRTLFPDMCFGCDRAGTSLCASCVNDLTRHQVRQQCAFCDQHVAHGICRRHAQKTGIARILALAPYAHPIARKLVEGNKYLGIASAPVTMSTLMLPLITDLPFAPTMIIPIPSTRSRMRARGGSHTLPLAVALARELNAPIHDAVLIRTKHTSPLARTHSPQERARILRGAFTVATPLSGERILFIDDVVTSGSTLREASRTLRASGASEIAAVVFAKA